MFFAGFVGFAGSRSLPSVSSPGGLVDRVVPPSSSSPLLSVFAAFGPGGAGAWSGSAVPVVSSASLLARSPGHGLCAPVAVHWWAGGQRSLPVVVRLFFRSRRLVRWLPAGDSVFVAFFGPGRCRGTRLSCRSAAERGLPVFAFPVGVPSLPSLGSGSWVASGGSGVWSLCRRWAPA